MDTNSSDSKIENTPPELREQANFLSLNLLPATSREKYERCHHFLPKMERIFKIKTKTDRAPQSQYPSERRYSASIVIGLSVVFLQLFLYSILMGTLVVHKMTVQTSSNSTINQNDPELIEELVTSDTANISNQLTDSSIETRNVSKDVLSLYDKISRDMGLDLTLQRSSQTYINVPVLMCSGCFLMALGYLLAFGTGVFAWKQWYIDHNITLFFLASALSSATAGAGLCLSLLTSIYLNFDYDNYEYESSRTSPVTFSLAMNVIILSSVGSIWSSLSTKVAYVGMKSSYPDDMVLHKGRRHVEVSTVKKGSKYGTAFPPDIIEHFPSGDKLAKYLPKKESGNLPKAESTLEYRQRVDKFLSEVPEVTVEKSTV